ncbi:MULTISPECIES: ABC transporter ATP-binding protein [Thalassospira]|jgi:multiple sugar transport system ATP-binding protein|uniref:Sugar ABC transporter ATPase n=2 Tax=Thalassospira tepidiphila TaxID=393657 RepID=A0A853KWP6_9PROT|nr:MULTISPECIES: sn-glycerol-3-phosphate ABC transporter ATP-binding protein UgpC [Thalassospira]KXJ53439.1 MAG: sugar ABC transporter ATP-binding protein [Thalassospira sp. Nap_22]MBO6577516.1 sn-glycerol-3-phosphate ABC transporter ATP-binding protein UgpC [Thalassospira sp.]MBO6819525.1 sn-glycerol-3-phosphate ABC transporter ATP-binding protein UgpC [Thalassospira sp.]MBO6888246.1 sn-glycerol-3-phosphate ABC transporter ATP-binding protein UgpC [Thalassospira sp.]MBP3126730.1 sn-glycerol-3|tara:strand:+ start:1854 stop:2966 length:1113 start_codon:yes stop_codon:yes gene_type:complete
MASLTLDKVRKAFGPVEVLKEINLAIDDGEFLVLVGPSGCGKSTLLNLIAGLETATDGEIRIGDRVINDVHPKDRNIAMVFQSYALYPNMTVRKNITFGLEIRGVSNQERDKAVADVAKLLQIEALLDRKPSQLSGGQRQRVAMGRALVRDPDIFLFDEPLSNLDAKLRVDMRTEIKKLHQRLGSTIVYVTHDQIEAMTLASRIAVMKDGILQQFDTPQNIYERPNNMFVAGFIGSPSMNFIDATLTEDNGKLALTIPRDGNPIVLPLFEAPESYRGYIGKDVVFGIRPEALTHKRTGSDEPGSQYVNFDSKVEVIEPTGADTMTVIEIAGKEIVARVRPDRQPKPGESMTFSADMSQISLFDPDTELRI